jgi:hypothetical protein
VASPRATLAPMDDRPQPAAGDEPRPLLRLVWSNPSPPLRPTNLALAIQRHLAGLDGLDQEDFLRKYSGAATGGSRALRLS